MVSSAAATARGTAASAATSARNLAGSAADTARETAAGAATAACDTARGAGEGTAYAAGAAVGAAQVRCAVQGVRALGAGCTSCLPPTCPSALPKARA